MGGVLYDRLALSQQCGLNRRTGRRNGLVNVGLEHVGVYRHLEDQLFFFGMVPGPNK
jgi:hypothetical protein